MAERDERERREEDETRGRREVPETRREGDEARARRVGSLAMVASGAGSARTAVRRWPRGAIRGGGMEGERVVEPGSAHGRAESTAWCWHEGSAGRPGGP